MKHFLLRTPRFSTQVLDELYSVESRVDLEKMVAKFLADRNVQHALFFSEPKLLIKYRNFCKTGSNPGIVDAIFKFLVRMAGRPTPAGSFASVCIGEFAPAADLQSEDIRGSSESAFRYRLDGDVIKTFIESSGSSWVSKANFLLNPTVRLDKNLIEFFDFKKTFFSAHSSFALVKSSAGLLKFLKNFERPTSFEEAKKKLRAQSKQDQEKLKETLAHLVKLNLLISSLGGKLIGVDRQFSFKQELQSVSKIGSDASAVSAELIKALDTAGDLRLLQSSSEKLKSYFEQLGEPLNLSPFRCDLVEDTSVKMDVRIFGQASEIPDVLFDCFAHHIVAASEAICTKEFREKFLSLYEDRIIPLLTLFEVGSPFVKIFSRRQKYSQDFPEMRRLQTKLIEECSGGEIKLDNNIISQLRKADQSLDLKVDPLLGWNAIVQVVRKGNDTLLSIPETYTGNPGRMFMRHSEFSKPLEHEIRRELKFLVDSYPGFTFADISYAPIGPAPNYMRRAEWAKSVIPLNSFPTKSKTRLIRLKDLGVRVHNNEIQLFSLSTGERILPLVTYPYTFEFDSNSLFCFLGTLAYQNQPLCLDWPWFVPTKRKPRVTYKGVTIALARWEFTRRDFLTQYKRDPLKFRREHELPRWVTINDHNRRLPVDLENPYAVEVVISNRLLSERIILEENFFKAAEPFIHRQTETYFAEVLCAGKFRRKRTAESNIQVVGPTSLSKYKPTGTSFRNWTIKGLSAYRVERIFRERILQWLKRNKISEFYYTFIGPSNELRLRVWKANANSFNLAKELLDLVEAGEAQVFESPFELELTTYKNSRDLSKYHSLSKLDSKAFVDFVSNTNSRPVETFLPSTAELLFLIGGIIEYLRFLKPELKDQIELVKKWSLGSSKPNGEAADECSAWFRKNKVEISSQLFSGRTVWSDTRAMRRKLLNGPAKSLLARRLVHMNCLRHPHGLKPGFESALLDLTYKLLQMARHYPPSK